MNHSTKLADLLQSTSGLHRARVTCLGRPRHRFVQGQNCQSGSTRHRLSQVLPTSTRTIDACNASSNTFNSNPLASHNSCSLFYPMPPTP